MTKRFYIYYLADDDNERALVAARDTAEAMDSFYFEVQEYLESKGKKVEVVKVEIGDELTAQEEMDYFINGDPFISYGEWLEKQKGNRKVENITDIYLETAKLLEAIYRHFDAEDAADRQKDYQEMLFGTDKEKQQAFSSIGICCREATRELNNMRKEVNV